MLTLNTTAMRTDYILKVTGNILLNTRGVDARTLASLTEESDLIVDLGLTVHQVKRVIIDLTGHFKMNLTEDAFEQSNMKFWVDYLLTSCMGLKSKSNRRYALNKAA